MPSPFPGMNPYLENPAIWPDFHTRIIAVMAEELERSIPQSYYVSVEEYVYIRELPDGERVHLGRPERVCLVRKLRYLLALPVPLYPVRSQFKFSSA